MQIIQAIILGLVQGITEFIPVSSSGHLLLVGHWLHFAYSGLGFDTALDIGTLAALGIFFRREFWELAMAVFRRSEKTKLAWLIVLGTIPGVIVGVLLEGAITRLHNSSIAVPVVAFNLIWVAGLMLWADRQAEMVALDGVTTGNALFIGVAQALALIPGVSRSGITITAGRARRFDRVSATKFSFLLSAPIIAGATAKETLKHSTRLEMAAHPAIYAVAILAALVSGYLAIKFMINYLSRHGLAVFAYYRIVVGALILVLGLR